MTSQADNYDSLLAVSGRPHGRKLALLSNRRVFYSSLECFIHFTNKSCRKRTCSEFALRLKFCELLLVNAPGTNRPGRNMYSIRPSCRDSRHVKYDLKVIWRTSVECVRNNLLRCHLICTDYKNAHYPAIFAHAWRLTECFTRYSEKTK